jgi:hypothetical protein
VVIQEYASTSAEFREKGASDLTDEPWPSFNPFKW